MLKLDRNPPRDPPVSNDRIFRGVPGLALEPIEPA